jgi:hypothetical protein
VQPKRSANHRATAAANTPPSAPTRARSVQRQTAPPRLAKVFPNLNPRNYGEVNREEIATLDRFFDQYRISRPGARGQTLPNARYVFITDTRGTIRMHPRYRHPVLAEGRSVAYAGEAAFRHGELEWWSNASGHYQPDPGHAVQAGLPLENFYTHEQVRAGVQQLKATRSPRSR